MAGPADGARASQALLKLFPKNTTRLHIKAAIDCFVRHALLLFVGVSAHQPSRNLLRRPLRPQLSGNEPAQGFVERELTGFGPPCAVPRALIRQRRAIGLAPAVPANFPADGRGGTFETPCNRTQGTIHGQSAGDFFALLKAQCQRDRVRARGRMPPVKARCGKIDDDARLNLRPMELSDSPHCHRSHISDFCLSV